MTSIRWLETMRFPRGGKFDFPSTNSAVPASGHGTLQNPMVRGLPRHVGTERESGKEVIEKKKEEGLTRNCEAGLYG